MTKISERLRNFIANKHKYSDEQISRELKRRLRQICKPCWELKYCPYGPLVEDFPLPPITRSEHKDHINYLRNCLISGYMGEGDSKVPLTSDRRKLFEEEIIEEPDYIVDEISDFEKSASCMEFGHLCPAYFVSEPFTETKVTRKVSRSISKSTIIRVVRRDNNTCQICGKILLDRDIEIDHIIPFSKGGSSEESNLRVTCKDCNRTKGDKLDFLHS